MIDLYLVFKPAPLVLAHAAGDGRRLQQDIVLEIEVEAAASMFDEPTSASCPSTTIILA